MLDGYVLSFNQCKEVKVMVDKLANCPDTAQKSEKPPVLQQFTYLSIDDEILVDKKIISNQPWSSIAEDLLVVTATASGYYISSMYSC